MLQRAAAIVGVGCARDRAARAERQRPPAFDADHAAALAGIGVPAFACTPDLFPELMAAAIERRDVSEWAATNDIPTSHTP